MKPSRYSWVLPCYNEAKSLPLLIAQIHRAMGDRSYEIIAVNDGSVDATGRILSTLASSFRALRVLTIPTHQGKWVALQKGISQARGGIIITIDSDLQDDPGELPTLLKMLSKRYDMVSGWRVSRHDPAFKVWISFLGNHLISRLTGRTWHDLNAPFKVYRRQVLTQIPMHGSLLRFSLLFAHNLGFRVAEVPIRHYPRRFGVSKFGLIKYLRILYDLALVLLLFSGSGRIKQTANGV